ncbi:hypothetical protein BCR33DRAFT_345373 [Rhizoclosmatium globosum]|uniref:TIR domain-containing protein n=1 Tax=Rhizoclosmatium globosum TaxID=329046 RepID=A0A1Y2C302_9FUNG|nr:hypothetical protein BCR33DRAFT_345373 [Rhizoclosmatium globosum]|eukprot:ORY41381.1 hypothetical protein BCR33DRAFT_345373 [Rhizoclosmatium globosum]
MMSYSWAQKDIVVEIANFLSDHGLRLWRDDHEMTGDIVLRMVEGITKSKLILVNMSKDYEKSKNCQRELTFSWDEEKPLIPIRLDKGPYPVTRFIVGTSLYYDFSDHLNNEAKKADLKMSLLQEIYRVLEFTPSVPLPKHVAVPKSLMVVNSFAQKVPKDFDVDAPMASAPMSSTPILTSTSLNSKDLLQSECQFSPPMDLSNVNGLATPNHIVLYPSMARKNTKPHPARTQ